MGAITGSVETTIMLNDFDDTSTVGDSFSGIVPTQRVKICFDHNKTEYLTAILASDSSGDFDTNLVSFSAFLLDSPPLLGISLPPSGALTLTTQIDSDTSTNRVDCTIFRIDEDWANLNQIKYCVGEWKFTYSDGTNTVTDYVRKTVDLNFRTFDETNIDFEGFEDETATTITDSICDSYTGKLYPVFSSNLVGEYTQAAVTYETKGGMQEENNHVNTNISQSDTPIVSNLSPVNPIEFEDEFQFAVDLAELNPNQAEYCFNTILVFEGALSATTCDCVTIELVQTLVSSNASQYSFTMDFTLSDITAGEVDNIEFSYNGTIIGAYQFDNTLTGTINVLLPRTLSNPDPNSEYTFILNRSNGCNYSQTVIMFPTTNTVTDSTCPLYCTLSFTSVDPTGSNVFFQTYGGTPVLGDAGGYFGIITAGQLIIDITDWLDLNGYTYDQVLVTCAAAGVQMINDVVITGTDLPIGEIEINYEDFNVETGVESGCLEAQPSTLCTMTWNGVTTDGLAYLQLADGTNVGDVAGYTGAQSLTCSTDLKEVAENDGFTCGTTSSGANGSGHVDFITIFNTNIPENYYRLVWLDTPQEVYGTSSGCVTT